MAIQEKQVLYEDNHLIAIDKPGGTIVQVDVTGDPSLEDMVKVFLARKYNKPNEAFLGVVHRLDRPVSGLIVFAKTSKATERMNALFKENQVKKTYWAIVRNRPPAGSGKLTHWLLRDTKKNVTRAYSKQVNGSKFSELSYEIIAEKDGYFLLAIYPVTGRTHQIRVQLSAMGCPIVGDNKYGYPRAGLRKTISLHAKSLEFLHPVRKDLLTIDAPLPSDPFWQKFSEF